MAKLLILIAIISTGIVACRKNTSSTDVLQGSWLKQGGGLPADTVRFISKNGKNIMAFQFSTSGGFNWPAYVETEYKFENGLLSLKDTTAGRNAFVPVESFEWVVSNKEFSVKLYQLVRYMSADYRVTYRKME